MSRAAPLAHAQDGRIATLDPSAADGAKDDYGDDYEYCGGGEEPSAVDLAFDEMEYGEPAVAHRDLVYLGLYGGASLEARTYTGRSVSM